MIRRSVTAALAGLTLLVGVSCGPSTPSGIGSKAGQSTGTTVSSQSVYVTALQTEIERVMKANVIAGAIVLIKSRDKGDWRATLGTGEIGKTAPLSMNEPVRIGKNTNAMTS